MLREDTQKKLICQTVLKDADGKVGSYTAFNDAIQSFLNNNDCESTIANIEIKDLKVLVLKVAPQKIVVDNCMKVIAQFFKK